MPTPSPRAIPVVLTQHAEEAAFLWLIRDAAVGAPHYKLWELARHDDRIAAHLDGLRIAGDAGWQFALEQLEAHPEPGETFAAGVLAFESGDPARAGRALEAVAAAPENGRGLASALGWLPQSVAVDRIKPLLASEFPVARRVGVAASALHRLNPGVALDKALGDPDARLRERALRAVGELGAPVWMPVLRKRLGDPDPSCRFAAAWSVARLANDPAAVGTLQDVAFSNSPRRVAAAQVALRRLDPPIANRWLGLLDEVPEGRRLSVQGAGILGDPAAVPRLLEAMKLPPLARVAGEAFSMITGVDLAYDDLDTDQPEGFEAGPTENPEDENVAMDEDGYLPWPHPEKVAAWWASNKRRFSPGTRYLCGRPLTPENLNRVLREGFQRQRAAAALELALRQPDRPLFEVRAPGFRQQQVLAVS